MSVKYQNVDNSISIPIISATTKIWFLRTQSGQYYQDYLVNDYIALGWDKISVEELLNTNLPRESQIEYIKKLYPSETRPGLILNQINIFKNKMQCGDFVIIPSRGSSQISIGIIEDLVEKISHIDLGEENKYDICNYYLKRKVNWLKTFETFYDIYLYRMLRAQQTISDVSKNSETIFRNLYNLYIYKGKLHLTLRKHTNTPYTIRDNNQLTTSIINICDEFSSIYNNDCQNTFECKTAISSPGFLEIISPIITPVTAGTIIVIYKALSNKYSKDGISTSGIAALLKSISDLFNDKSDRKLKAAQTDKTIAETEYIKATAQREFIQAKRDEIQLKKDELELEQHQLKIKSELSILKETAKNIGIENIDSKRAS